jgi:hypothetical protein
MDGVGSLQMIKIMEATFIKRDATQYIVCDLEVLKTNPSRKT